MVPRWPRDGLICCIFLWNCFGLSSWAILALSVFTLVKPLLRHRFVFALTSLFCCFAFALPRLSNSSGRDALKTSPGLGNITKRTNQPTTEQLATRFHQPNSQKAKAATRTAILTQRSLAGRNTCTFQAPVASAGVAKRLQFKVF